MGASDRLQWGLEGLWQRLEPLLPGLSVEVVARAESTSTALLERARAAAGRRAGDALPCLLVAETQTHGRGRQGRTWSSAPAGASLTFSLSLPLEPADWSGLSLAVGVAVADALEPEPAPGGWRIGLKWPNDLWVVDAPAHGRKLGGVLVETLAVGPRRMAVIGIGLNVLPIGAAETADLGSGYACLQEIDAEAAAPAALNRVAPALVRALLDFEHAGYAPLGEHYARRDLLRGHAVTTTSPELPDGIARGVAPDGRLRIDRGGSVALLASGEVSVRLRAAAPPD